MLYCTKARRSIVLFNSWCALSREEKSIFDVADSDAACVGVFLHELQ